MEQCLSAKARIFSGAKRAVSFVIFVDCDRLFWIGKWSREGVRAAVSAFGEARVRAERRAATRAQVSAVG
jgi:hypothetical protein